MPTATRFGYPNFDPSCEENQSEDPDVGTASGSGTQGTQAAVSENPAPKRLRTPGTGAYERMRYHCGFGPLMALTTQTRPVLPPCKQHMCMRTCVFGPWVGNAHFKWCGGRRTSSWKSVENSISFLLFQTFCFGGDGADNDDDDDDDDDHVDDAGDGEDNDDDDDVDDGDEDDDDDTDDDDGDDDADDADDDVADDDDAHDDDDDDDAGGDAEDEADDDAADGGDDRDDDVDDDDDNDDDDDDDDDDDERARIRILASTSSFSQRAQGTNIPCVSFSQHSQGQNIPCVCSPTDLATSRLCAHLFVNISPQGLQKTSVLVVGLVAMSKLTGCAKLFP